jgi:hypothetical protein
MRRLLAATAILLATVTAPVCFIGEPRAEASDVVPAACCKVCSKGKACGNSCIARNKQCHKPRGCACDA